MTIEFNHYGICVDSEWFYIALDWKLLATAALVFVGYKVYRKKFIKL